MKESNEILKKGLNSIAQMIYEQNKVAAESLGVEVEEENETDKD